MMDDVEDKSLYIENWIVFFKLASILAIIVNNIVLLYNMLYF